MKTVKESPQARLRREMGWQRPSHSINVAGCTFKCGDQVFTHTDPRHVGTIVAIKDGLVAFVRWNETGWNEEISIDLLVLHCWVEHT